MRKLNVLLLFSILANVCCINIKDYELELEKEIHQEVRSHPGISRRLPRAAVEDGDLKVPALIQKYEYPFEEYTVETVDGYILHMHRIPHGKKETVANSKVVFLMHGILSSSSDWVIPGPEKGFAYNLAKTGFDVWMGNARGNRYSRTHKTLNPDSDSDKAQYWDFSWHEIGTIDVPAMIELVLKTTGQEKLFYIGHSQGTTSFYVMCSERPEYNQKIIAQFSLAPVAYMSHLYSPLVRMLAMAEFGLYHFMSTIGLYEFQPTQSFIDYLTKEMCVHEMKKSLCSNAIFATCGFNEKQMNMTLLPMYLGHFPAGSATKQLVHYAQEINSGKFCQYDYGFFGNIVKYGQYCPPLYNLSNVVAPVYLLYSNNDWLSEMTDVWRLCNELVNCKKVRIKDPKFSHLDYLIGIDAVEYVFKPIIEKMNKFLV